MRQLYLKSIVIFIVSICVLFFYSPAVHAKELKNKGLYVSPLRQLIEVDNSVPYKGQITVANYTNKQAQIKLFVEEFSVTDYDYDYRFKSPPSHQWIKLSQESVSLAPNKSKKIDYTIIVPDRVAPGGYYFTLFASQNIPASNGLAKEVRAGALLNVTVKGNLVYSNYVESSTVPWIVVGESIPLDIDIRNDGNVHFFSSITARTRGLFTNYLVQTGNHQFFPHTIRSLSAEFPSPKVPGIYRFEYGYSGTSIGVAQKERYFLYVPVWFLCLLVVMGGISLYLVYGKIKLRVQKSKNR